MPGKSSKGGSKKVVVNGDVPKNNFASSAVIPKATFTPVVIKPAESFGIPGKSYDTSGTKTLDIPVGETPVVRDSGSSLRGFQTPMGTSLGLTKTDKKNVLGAALLVSSLPAKAGSVPAIAGAKLAGKFYSRYVAPPVIEAMGSAFKAASKGLEKIVPGSTRVYKSNTVFGSTLASTKVSSVAQTEARLTGLEANAVRIATSAGRGALLGATNIVKDLQTGKKIVKGAAVLGGLYTLKNSKRR